MKKILISGFIILIICFGYFVYKNRLLSTKNLVVQEKISVYLKLLGQSDFIKQEVVSNKTALDFTKEKAKISMKGDGTNAYIVGINGRLAEDSKKEFWSFYINGKMSEVGAGSYILKDGDKIEWKIGEY